MNMAMVRNLIIRLTQKCNLYKIWISPMGLLYHSQRAKNTSSNKEISRHLRTRSITTFTRDVTKDRVQRRKNPIHVLTSCYFYTGLLFQQPTLMHNFLYSQTICLLHYYPRHVSSINMPIFRKKNCIHTTSGIFALCKRLHSTLVESGLQSALNQCTV